MTKNDNYDTCGDNDSDHHSISNEDCNYITNNTNYNYDEKDDNDVNNIINIITNNDDNDKKIK